MGGSTPVNELLISEVFGPTLQGEGRSQGRPAFFIRLGLCNLDCRWCDTPYTWDWTGKNGVAYSKADLMRISPEEVADMIPVGTPRVIITGGEPMVQAKQLIRLINCIDQSVAVEVETNGTLSPYGVQPWVHFNVSPKLPHSGVAWDKAINYSILSEYAERDADFKIVVSTVEDIAYVKDLEEHAGIDPSHIWLMPEGRSGQAIQDTLAFWFGVCADHAWSLSPRLHVLAFDDKRGI